MFAKLLSKLNIKDLSQKQFWLSVLFLLSGFGFCFFVYLALTFDLRIWSLLASSVLWLLLAGFSMLFLQRGLLLMVYGTLALTLVIFFGFRGFVSLGIILFLLSIWFAHNRAKAMRDSLFKFKPFYITKKFFPVFFTGLALFLAIAWQGFIFKDLQEAPQISPRVYSAVFVPTETILQRVVPGYTKGMTMGEIQTFLAETILNKILPDQDTQGFFGVDSAPANEAQQELFALTLEEFTFFWFNTHINSLVTPYLGLAPFFIILALFLVMKFVFWYLKWAIIGLLIIVIKIMMWYNILTIREVQRISKVPVLE